MFKKILSGLETVTGYLISISKSIVDLRIEVGLLRENIKDVKRTLEMLQDNHTADDIGTGLNNIMRYDGRGKKDV